MSDPGIVAGERYRLAWQIIQGGDAIGMLAGHITWMLGDNEWKRPVWRERAIPPDGKTFETKSFDQYLLEPAREGLGLPTLLTAQKLCEANAQYGAKAIAMMRREIGEYDKRIAADQRVVLDNVPGVLSHSEAGAMGGRGNKASDNVTGFERGNSETYLASRLKRDAKPIWDAYMAGEYRSVRAAAKEAGIVKERPLAELRRWWKRATVKERAIFQAEIGG